MFIYALDDAIEEAKKRVRKTWPKRTKVRKKLSSGKVHTYWYVYNYQPVDVEAKREAMQFVFSWAPEWRAARAAICHAAGIPLDRYERYVWHQLGRDLMHRATKKKRAIHFRMDDVRRLIYYAQQESDRSGAAPRDAGPARDGQTDAGLGPAAQGREPDRDVGECES
jgi:hypothetical protein